MKKEKEMKTEQIEEYNYELITRKNVKDTPFTIITNNEEGRSFGTIGKYKITEERKTPEEVEEEITKITWDNIIKIMTIIIEINNNNNK